MKSSRFAAAAAALAIVACSAHPPRDAQHQPPAAAASQLKSIPLHVFMHGEIPARIMLPVPVPAEYEWASLSAPVSYSYWMRPEDVAAVGTSGDLPSKNGFMYGKVSMNVGYDKDRDVFIGADDPESLKKARSLFPSVKTERFTYEEYPVLLVSMEAPDSGNLVYAMYVGMNISTNVVFVALSPQGNSKEVGDRIWGELEKALVKAKP